MHPYRSLGCLRISEKNVKFSATIRRSGQTSSFNLMLRISPSQWLPGILKCILLLYIYSHHLHFLHLKASWNADDQCTDTDFRAQMAHLHINTLWWSCWSLLKMSRKTLNFIVFWSLGTHQPFSDDGDSSAVFNRLKTLIGNRNSFTVRENCAAYYSHLGFKKLSCALCACVQLST
jgi:hypothetical protein